MRPLERTAKYHETTKQRVERERHEKALKAYLDCKDTVQKDSQNTFNPIMGVIVVVVLTISAMLALPRAIDRWHHDQYEKPVQEYKQMETKAKEPGLK